MDYAGRSVLVTGGLGFIGSNLAVRLAELGAKVTIVDGLIPGCGANPYNVEPLRGRAKVINLDIGDAEQFAGELGDAGVIFNLAGEISHAHSVQFPERDLQINTVSQLRFLRACCRHAPGIRIVYASTRQIYGRPDRLPVSEEHPIRPVDFNGVHKYAATMYHLMLSRSGELDAACLRLTNVYGPRMAINTPCQGVLNAFLRCALTGEPISVFGDGAQLRDPVYVEDVVEAFLLAGAVPKLPSRSYNVGGAACLTLNELAEVCARAGGTLIRHRQFPADRRAYDIGSYSTDSSRIGAELGWRPRTRLEDGIARTVEFFRRELGHYLDPSEPRPNCGMPDHNGPTRRLLLMKVP